MGLKATDGEFKEICRALAAFRERRHGYCGTEFGYLGAFEPQSSVWLMQLYDFFVWLGTVDSRGVEGAVDVPSSLPPTTDWNLRFSS